MHWTLNFGSATFSHLPSTAMFDRFVNNNALVAVVRPQPFKMCAPLSLLEARQVLGLEPITLEDLIKSSGYTRTQIATGKVSNEDMRTIALKFSMQVDVHDIAAPSWDLLKEYVREGAVIYHRPGHYCLVVGFLEEPMLTSSGPRPKVEDALGRWLILADHRVKKPTDHTQGMLATLRYEEVAQTVESNERAALLLCRRTH
jgi:hypothetical protein